MVYKPGDFIIVHGTGFIDHLIQFGQRLRFPKKDAYWNHVALVISSDGDLIEALATGVKQTHISKYEARDGQKAKAALISITASDEDRQEIVTFAKSCLSDGYGWIDILSASLCLLFGLKFQFGYSGTIICSGLVAKSLEHGGKVLDRDADHCTPADLVRIFTP